MALDLRVGVEPVGHPRVYCKKVCEYFPVGIGVHVSLTAQAVPEIQVVGDDRNPASRNGIGESHLDVRCMPAVGVRPDEEIALLSSLGNLTRSSHRLLKALNPMPHSTKSFGAMGFRTIRNQEVPQKSYPHANSPCSSRAAKRYTS